MKGESALGLLDYFYCCCDQECIVSFVQRKERIEAKAYLATRTSINVFSNRRDDVFLDLRIFKTFFHFVKKKIIMNTIIQFQTLLLILILHYYRQMNQLASYRFTASSKPARHVGATVSAGAANAAWLSLSIVSFPVSSSVPDKVGRCFMIGC